jgi:hypothetical protein
MHPPSSFSVRFVCPNLRTGPSYLALSVLCLAQFKLSQTGPIYIHIALANDALAASTSFFRLSCSSSAQGPSTLS